MDIFAQISASVVLDRDITPFEVQVKEVSFWSGKVRAMCKWQTRA